MDTETITGLMSRIRAGDEQAAAELVTRFEPEIRRRLRTWIRLRGPEQRSQFESMDICQSVLATFFVRARSEDYDLSRPEQVLNLLAVMARRRLGEQVRDGRRLRRDARRNRPLEPGDQEPATKPAESPSRIAADREILREVDARFSTQEKRVAEMRANGAEWTDVAAELGGTPDSRRKQWSRAPGEGGGPAGYRPGTGGTARIRRSTEARCGQRIGDRR